MECLSCFVGYGVIFEGDIDVVMFWWICDLSVRCESFMRSRLVKYMRSVVLMRLVFRLMLMIDGMVLL